MNFTSLIITSLALSLCASIIVNVILVLKRTKGGKTNQSLELQEFIADLAGGGLGMIAIARIDPNDILMRSPKK